MKVISFVEQPSLIRCILKRLELQEDSGLPPRTLKSVCEPDRDYVPWKDDVLEVDSARETGIPSTGCLYGGSAEMQKADHTVERPAEIVGVIRTLLENCTGS